MPAKRLAGQQRVDPLPRRRRVAAIDVPADLLDRATQRAVILIQEDGGGPFGSRFRQGQQCRRRDGIVGLRLRPFPPRHAAASRRDQRLLDPCRGGPSTVAMEFRSRVAATAYNDLLAGVAAVTSDDEPVGGASGQRAAAASAEVRRDRLDGA